MKLLIMTKIDAFEEDDELVLCFIEDDRSRSGEVGKLFRVIKEIYPLLDKKLLLRTTAR